MQKAESYKLANIVEAFALEMTVKRLAFLYIFNNSLTLPLKVCTVNASCFLRNGHCLGHSVILRCAPVYSII